MTARIGVVTFPGTLDDVDAARARGRWAPRWSACGMPTPTLRVSTP